MWNKTKWVMRVPNHFPPVTGGIAVLDFEKAEALGDCLVFHFQLKSDPSEPAFIEKFDDALRTYFFTPIKESKLTNSFEFQDVIRVSKVGKVPGPNNTANRALKHNTQQTVSVLAKLFNVALPTQHFPLIWNHAHMTSILKPGGTDAAVIISFHKSAGHMADYFKRSYLPGS
jgi:hypothetical protein